MRLLRLTLVLLIWTAVLPAQEAPTEWSLQARELVVLDLIGKVSVEPSPDESFHIRASVGGADASPGAIRFELDRGEEARFHAVFPLRKTRRFRYPEARERTVIRNWGQRTGTSVVVQVFDFLKGKRIVIDPDEGEMEIWCDLRILVPDGASLKVFSGAGDLEAVKVRANVTLDGYASPVTFKDCSGFLIGDTASGDVEFLRCSGEMLGDVASGNVRGTEVSGESFRGDTASGSVTLQRASVDNIVADTGSGHVSMMQVKAESIIADTGSGDVLLEGVISPHILADTGSGDVRIQLEETPEGRLVVDTGSGDVEIIVPQKAGIKVDVDTGSGPIRFEGLGVKDLRTDTGEAHFRVGDGRFAISVDTGSGRVTIRKRAS
jgi:hypothetical protein